MTITRFRPAIGRRQLSSSIGDPVRANTVSARDGMSEIIRNYKMLTAHLHDVTAEVLELALQPAFKKSQVYVPVDSGKLKTSGYLRTTAWRGHAVTEIGYGAGGTPDYAATVHENMRWKHKAPTRAKFLETAINESWPEMMLSIKANYQRAGGFQ